MELNEVLSCFARLYNEHTKRDAALIDAWCDRFPQFEKDISDYATIVDLICLIGKPEISMEIVKQHNPTSLKIFRETAK